MDTEAASSASRTRAENADRTDKLRTVDRVSDFRVEDFGAKLHGLLMLGVLKARGLNLKTLPGNS